MTNLARRSILKQWLDVSGPSLVALRIHSALSQSAQRLTLRPR